MKTANTQMPEEQAVHLVRNALLVAGAEMGAEGDHWPVIQSTIHSVMQDWENLKVERNVDAELKMHLYAQLAQMEIGLETCTAEARAKVAPQLKELREVYDAYFSSVGDTEFTLSDNEVPAYLKRAKMIMNTLEEENA